MLRFRLYFDKDEETKWLNQMSEEGWAMRRFFAGFYRFEKCERGKYIYQVDFGEKLFDVSDEYREFMQDTGVEIVQTWGYWIILRKLASEGTFELYTDVDSSIEHYSKIRRMFQIATIVELVCLFVEILTGMAGNPWGDACAFVLGAIVLALINALVKTNNIIEELKERKSGVSSEERNRNVSALLPCGFLINACALLMEDSVSRYIKITVQIIAIILMLAGAYQTGKNRRSN